MEQLSRTARFWQWWAAFSLRRPLLVTLLGILAFVASVPFAARLYGDLRTDLRELLPQGAPAAVALAELEKRIGGLSHLAIVVRTDDLKAGERFVRRAVEHHGGARPGARREEHLRVHALARVLLHGTIKNIQVSWVKLGFETSLACLNAGANDFSGTLMEENISKAAGATFGEYVAPQDFRRMIRSIGRVPAERTTTYKIRHLYNGDDEPAAPAQPQLNLVQNATHVSYAEGAY